MNAEIVTTGTELLLGEIVDTNAVHIARQLRDIGVNLFYKTTVGDNQARLAEVLRLGMSRSDVIILTGGLGPTVDDITREAVAEATGRELEQRQDIVRRLRAQFAGWGRPFTENNLRQTYLPAGSQIVPNPIGTAPGFIVDTGRCAIICMPGVPREMKRMLADEVVPYLLERMGDQQAVIIARVLHTAGIGESLIDDRISHLMTLGNPTVGLAAHMGRVDVRLTARAASVAEAEALLAPLEVEVRQRLQPFIFGVDDDTLAGIVARLLRERSQRVAIVETNTAGKVAEALAAEDAAVIAQAVRLDSLAEVAAYLNAQTAAAIDESTAGRLAQQSRATAGANHALALLGTFDPNHGFWSAERGLTCLGIATPEGTITDQFNVGGGDEYTCAWLTVYGLNRLRRALLAA